MAMVIISTYWNFLFDVRAPLVSQARNVIEATGNDVNSAVIKDSKGKVMAHDAQLPEDQAYTINYNWRIPDNLKIKAGDTMAFKSPKTFVFHMTRLFQ